MFFQRFYPRAGGELYLIKNKFQRFDISFTPRTQFLTLDVGYRNLKNIGTMIFSVILRLLNDTLLFSLLGRKGLRMEYYLLQYFKGNL